MGKLIEFAVVLVLLGLFAWTTLPLWKKDDHDFES